MADDLATNATPYEFTPEQGKVIGELGRSMRVVGLVALAYAVIGIALLAITAWKTGVIAIDLNPILAIFLGLWATAGGRSFLEVAATQGNDIPLLMTALGKLRNIFKLIAILMVAALIIAAIVLTLVAIYRPAATSVTVFGNPVA
jgi:hypothetical protein